MNAPSDDEILSRQIRLPGFTEEGEVFFTLTMRRLGGWINKGQHRAIKEALRTQADLGVPITLEEMEKWYKKITAPE